MSTFRRGLVQQPSSAQPQQGSPTTMRPRFVTKIDDTRSSIIVTPEQARPAPPVRGVIVDTGGKLIRGLSQATVQAHTAHNETTSERCPNCGEMRTPAQMQTVINNAYNPNNPLRMCQACAQLAYKNPHDERLNWKPSVPQVRFDRERGAPYDARRAGVTISDLVNRDAYHSEQEASHEQRALRPEKRGVWSGGGRAGHVSTPETLERSRQAVRRR